MDEYAEGYEPEITFRKYAASRGAQSPDEVRDIVTLLAGHARGGPVLELGIGTGRIAIPLRAEGLRVDGVEISTPVVTRLRQEAGGEDIDVTIGNFAHIEFPDRYRLIFVVANALLNLYTQDDQVSCFENVARHLTEGGRFIVSAFGPGFITSLDGRVRSDSIDADRVRLEMHRHDAATQIVEWSYVTLSQGHVEMFPIVQRYIWPSEMDLMAKAAGLTLVERWGGWRKEPLTAASELQVAVYGL